MFLRDHINFVENWLKTVVINSDVKFIIIEMNHKLIRWF